MKRFVVVAMVLAGGCPKGGAGSSGGGGFRVFYPDAGASGVRAKVGARMQARPAADCKNTEGVEARWANTGARVVAGELPPGLVIEDGAIAGVPEEPGTFRASVIFTGITCAAAPVADQTVDVTISVSAAR
jgi:hypothetical protein